MNTIFWIQKEGFSRQFTFFFMSFNKPQKLKEREGKNRKSKNKAFIIPTTGLQDMFSGGGMSLFVIEKPLLPDMFTNIYPRNRFAQYPGGLTVGLRPFYLFA